MISVETWKTAYDEDNSVIYLIDAEKRVIRCNRGWDRFALANGGDKSVSGRVVGTDIMAIVPLELREFYRAAYDNVQRHRREWWHMFECSSATQKRVFQMRILPSDDGGLLTINTLTISSDLEVPEPRIVSDYADSEGIVTMCSHCRRVRRLGRPRGWDWVPQLLIGTQTLVTYGLCEFCTAYHYAAR